MKLKHAFFLCFLLALSAFSAKIISTQPLNSQAIPIGGNTYQTHGSNEEKIGITGIQTWTNSDSEFSVFVKSAEETVISLDLDILSQESKSTIIVELNGQSHTVTLSPESTDIIAVGEFELVKGYNEIKLRGIEKAGTHFAKIKNLMIKSEIELRLDFVKDNNDNRFYWGRRGPSVHLSYTLPRETNFKWFYNEVTVPEGSDPIGSYFMANGFAEGYFGIQVNSQTERRVLFSVWSPFETDNPREIPGEEKIILLKKGNDVYTGEFGNEGSGGQSFLKYNWKTGRTYSFLNSVAPDGKGNTTYTAYFLDPEVGEWMLIASFLRPKTDTWYERPHSFLENFIPESGHLERTAKYENQWAADQNGNWVDLTEAKFTGDDIAKRGFRKDFAGGERDGQFYLRNGGFFDGFVELNSMHKRASTGVAPAVYFTKLP